MKQLFWLVLFVAIVIFFATRDPVAPPQPPAPPTAAELHKTACEHDYKKCTDLSDAMDNNIAIIGARADCQYDANDKAKYGSPPMAMDTL
jgi:hypothetical protein